MDDDRLHPTAGNAKTEQQSRDNKNTSYCSDMAVEKSSSAGKTMITTPNSATSSTTDYRTTIHFLTSPSSTTTAVTTGSAMDCDEEGTPGPSSVPVSALLSPEEDRPREFGGISAYYSSSTSATPPRRDPALLPPIHASPTDGVKYRDDELTGMAGLMELASPPNQQSYHGTDAAHPMPKFDPNSQLRFGINTDTYSSTASSNSTSSHTVPPALGITGTNSNPGSTYSVHGYSQAPPPHQYSYHQQQQQYHQQQRPHYPYPQQHSQPQMQLHPPARHPAHGNTASIGPSLPISGPALTPDSIPSASLHRTTHSFPATMDDAKIARRRSQSTDSVHNSDAYGHNSALPYVLGNANIRNRSFTSTQRQRTSDTPLFPILLHRIISNPENESWIRWCEDGKAFKFSSADKLLACLQAAGLRAQNYHSIEKNLNDYRFTRLTDQRRKIPDPDGKLWWMFSHPQFLRDYPDGIVNIQRRRRTNPAPVSPQPPVLPPHPQPHSHPQMPPRHSGNQIIQQQQQQQHYIKPENQHYSSPHS
ncbi:Heat shock transcription factor [Coemansia sp. RSA 1646]|nr:Heat shock transcription factor [Coemansia sp. RSA 1646]KAJ1773565.1 Heat shock transcription factor [Coemansia sp. RSA 1843]KAJ2092418.1 Heat shock transcription factor [Coemansia sp. RSA 986]KAJ2217357.1 Heat shock transcription factor [Coemansia sp. RSA 487]